MPTQLRQDIYVIKVPLPNNPLRDLNSYYIRGKERDLLIDTGFNLDACYDALTTGLRELGADMARTDLMLTHFHSDHCGLYDRVSRPGTRVFMGEKDLALHRLAPTGGLWSQAAGLSLGFSPAELRENMSANPAVTAVPEHKTEILPLLGGDILEVGDYALQAVHTPGHTPGHICLYDAERETLFCGDSILYDITPVISIWPDRPGALASYLSTLQKMRTLRVKYAYAAHRQPCGNLGERAEQLLEHHYKRLDDVSAVLVRHAGGSCYELASFMKWQIRAASWAEFPVSQRWFATAEAASHLEYLWQQGKAGRELDGGVWRYYPRGIS
ncbi:MAG: MBL fold metallo-hydrolase [Oscillospiraceae bacterium]|jgi:glyoxylase-like metal-dependent hydrolase (beta-lactamase superfamily II)|nr:MBL fold metallo-hydrolase [Oscillospiraceae bacterium]